MKLLLFFILTYSLAGCYGILLDPSSRFYQHYSLISSYQSLNNSVTIDDLINLDIISKQNLLKQMVRSSLGDVSSLEMNNQTYPSIIGVQQAMKIIKKILGSYFPGLFLDKNVQCYKDTKLLVDKIKKGNLWALKALDSMGSIPDGIFLQNGQVWGNFDECISIQEKVEDIRWQGQYCSVSVFPTTKLDGLEKFWKSLNIILLKYMKESGFMFPYTRGICVPASCSHEEVMSGLMTAMKDTGLIERVKKDYCTIETIYELRPIDYAVFTVFGLIGAMMLAGTTYDLMMVHKIGPFKVKSGEQREVQAPKKKTMVEEILLCFSIYTNTKKIMSTKAIEQRLACVNGIRAITMLWILLCHGFTTIDGPYLYNPADILHFMTKFSSQIFANPSCSVDTFLLLSGVFLTYVLLKQLDGLKKSRGAIPVVVRVKIYFIALVNRLIRIWSVFAVVILWYLSFYIYMDEGPFWKSVNNELFVEPCWKNWWTSILFVQNYVNSEFMCVPHAWYLSVDMQCYIIFSLLIIILHGRRRVMFILLSLWLAGQILINAVITKVSGIPPTALLNSYMKDYPDFMWRYYPKTHLRTAPYVVGIALGWILHETRNTQIKIPKIYVAIGWAFAFLGSFGVIFGLYPIFHDPNLKPNNIELYLYGSLQRPVWALCVAWVIIACSNGYGAIINSVLSAGFLMPISKLSFAMYMVGMCLQTVYSSASKVPRYWTFKDELIYLFAGNVALGLVVSLLVSLSFESPVLGIQKLLLKPKQNVAIKKTELELGKAVHEKPADEGQTRF